MVQPRVRRRRDAHLSKGRTSARSGRLPRARRRRSERERRRRSPEARRRRRRSSKRARRRRSSKPRRRYATVEDATIALSGLTIAADLDAWCDDAGGRGEHAKPHLRLVAECGMFLLKRNCRLVCVRGSRAATRRSAFRRREIRDGSRAGPAAPRQGRGRARGSVVSGAGPLVAARGEGRDGLRVLRRAREQRRVRRRPRRVARGLPVTLRGAELSKNGIAATPRRRRVRRGRVAAPLPRGLCATPPRIRPDAAQVRRAPRL